MSITTRASSRGMGVRSWKDSKQSLDSDTALVHAALRGALVTRARTVKQLVVVVVVLAGTKTHTMSSLLSLGLCKQWTLGGIQSTC